MLPFYPALEFTQASDATLLACRTFTRVFAARRERPQPAHTANHRHEARNLVWFHASWGSRPVPASNGSRQRVSRGIAGGSWRRSAERNIPVSQGLGGLGDKALQYRYPAGQDRERSQGRWSVESPERNDAIDPT
ncbi:hypothetical protein CcaCcLH18_01544 [Colletotrichum camelliae]|nr:hypothetical protein CcaCcLH18_01544 [Colletotrichum camelliae]